MKESWKAKFYVIKFSYFIILLKTYEITEKKESFTFDLFIFLIGYCKKEEGEYFINITNVFLFHSRKKSKINLFCKKNHHTIIQ